MSLKLCCCLCCKSCSEFKSLRNFWGESNEVYKITVKYFDPLLLTDNVVDIISSKDSSVLCLDCWLHIKDFHEFHETVIKARSSLEQTTSDQKSELNSVLEKKVTVISNAKYVDGVQDGLQTGLKGDSGTVNVDDMRNEEVPLIEDVQNPIEEEGSENLNDYEVGASMEDVPSSIGSDSEIINDDVEPSNKDLKIINDVDDIPLSELVQAQKSEKQSIKSNNKLQHKETYPSNNLREDKKRDKPNPRIDRNQKDYFEEIRKKDEFIRKWKSELECDICGEKFPIFDNLTEHFRRKHNNVKCYIRCCNRKLYRRYDLIEHINVHINPETYKCNICGKLSSTKSSHKIHLGTHEENREKFECNVCQKTFKHKNTLEGHLLTHVTGSKDFKCNQCDKAFVVEDLLKKHIQTFHSRTKICDTCGKKLRDSGALKKHIMALHSGIAKPKHPCDVCGLELASSFNLKLHKASYHNDGSTVYVCSICDKITGSERALSFHIKYSHLYQLKHKCPHCDKAFKRPQSLREHIATHTGEALYFCDLCPKTFKMQTKRSAHRKKFHPVEWKKDKKVILEKKQIDMDRVTNKVVV